MYRLLRCSSIKTCRVGWKYYDVYMARNQKERWRTKNNRSHAKRTSRYALKESQSYMGCSGFASLVRNIERTEQSSNMQPHHHTFWLHERQDKQGKGDTDGIGRKE